MMCAVFVARGAAWLCDARTGCLIVVFVLCSLSTFAIVLIGICVCVCVSCLTVVDESVCQWSRMVHQPQMSTDVVGEEMKA